MCKGQKGGRSKGAGLWGCLPGKELAAQPDPPLHTLGLSFGNEGAASPLRVLSTLGPASSTGSPCWGYVVGRWPLNPQLQSPQCFC